MMDVMWWAVLQAKRNMELELEAVRALQEQGKAAAAGRRESGAGWIRWLLCLLHWCRHALEASQLGGGGGRAAREVGRRAGPRIRMDGRVMDGELAWCLLCHPSIRAIKESADMAEQAELRKKQRQKQQQHSKKQEQHDGDDDEEEAVGRTERGLDRGIAGRRTKVD